MTGKEVIEATSELINKATEDEQNFIMGVIYGTLYKKSKEEDKKNEAIN